MRATGALDRRPAILVHGWNSHPGIWNRLVLRLEGAGRPCWSFEHSGMVDEGLAGRALALAAYVDAMRSETAYDGPVDVVCHSFGACIARQCLEVADGAARRFRVGQLVMLGPPNTGSALAELFSDPGCGPAAIAKLERLFVPAEFDPLADAVVQDVRPGSTTMRSLRAAGQRADIAYRVIATANPGADRAFFPRFDGMTWELDGEGRFRRTLDGDGVVAISESALPGVPLDLLVPGAGGVPPGQYCHIVLPRNPAVIERVMAHLSRGHSDPAGRAGAGADRTDDPSGRRDGRGRPAPSPSGHRGSLRP